MSRKIHYTIYSGVIIEGIDFYGCNVGFKYYSCNMKHLIRRGTEAPFLTILPNDLSGVFTWCNINLGDVLQIPLEEKLEVTLKCEEVTCITCKEESALFLLSTKYKGGTSGRTK